MVMIVVGILGVFVAVCIFILPVGMCMGMDMFVYMGVQQTVMAVFVVVGVDMLMGVL